VHFDDIPQATTSAHTGTPPVLPPVADLASFREERSKPLESWLPAIRTIGARHGLPVDCGQITRFTNGENPVFAHGESWVLKLVPPFASDALTREVALLESLRAQPDVWSPSVLAHGRLDGWRYLIETRLTGTPLHRIWPDLVRHEQETLAEKFGRLLRVLHEAPMDEATPAAFPDWNRFVRDAATHWPTRWGIERVPEALRADGPRFLAAAGLLELDQPVTLWRRVHGDLAPENALAQQDGGTWEMSGMIDFGNAMVGDPLFDYTAPTVLLQPGDAMIVRRFLTGAGGPSATPMSALRQRLMAYTMIHPMGDLRDCLELLPDGVACRTWDEVARRFWPDDAEQAP
jgi:hygromycin-B 7''-O-kinase